VGNYVEQLLETKEVFTFNDYRTIISDRMGPWHEQSIILTWEGECKNDDISATPDEVEVLFKNGMTRNVYGISTGKLRMGFTYADIRIYNGAIVCGIMAPSTAASIRPEILEYAKKMGYVTDEMTPVKMASGTKTLIYNDDGSYGVFYEWSSSVTQRIEFGFLKKFTMKFFSGYENVTVEKNGVLLNNLVEEKVFSRSNIDTLRVYDIQLKYLDPAIDKTLLLRAAIQVAFIDIPYNTLGGVDFKESNNIMIPNNIKTSITFDEFGMAQMKCGKAYHDDENGFESYTYEITVPYKEAIRELFCDVEKVLNARYGKDGHVFFSKYREYIGVSVNRADIGQDVERAFICIDYALSLLQEERSFNSYLFYRAIFSLLEADSSGIFKEEYFSYLEMMKKLFPEK